MATRADIRGLARIYADQDSSDFPTDTQYNVILDAAGRKVWIDLIRAGWPASFATTTLTSNGATIYSPAALTSGIFSVVGVYYTVGGQRMELRRINEGDRAGLLSADAATDRGSFYDVRVNGTGGFDIEILPANGGVSYLIDYIAGFSGFANDASVWPGPITSDELVAIKAAMRGMFKEGQARIPDTQALKAEYMEILEGIRDTASWVNGRNAPQIRDVSMSRQRTAFDYPVAGFSGDIYG